MSNPTGAFGLKPVRHFSGAPWNGMTQLCYISASNAVDMFIGDPVVMENTAAYRDATGKRMTIELATPGTTNPVHGVVTGFKPLETDLYKLYHPASTEGWAFVCMAPDVVYQIRGSGSGTPSANWIGANANILTGTGSQTTGLSGMTLDEASDTPNATQADQLLIVGLANREDISLDDYGLWEVLLNTPWNAAGIRVGVLSS